MRHHASFIIASVLIFVPGCERTRLAHLAGGTGGASALGGATFAGGIAATGGDLAAAGGSTSAAGGVVGSGGVQAAGGVIGTGGSTSDLDSCSSDADCLSSCIWVTAPTNSSQCTANYCCGMTRISQRRCNANQAAWASYCPNQSPTSFPCPCVAMCDHEIFGCVGGRCTTSCPPVADAAPDFAFDGAVVPDANVRDASVPDRAFHDELPSGCTQLPIEWAEEPSPAVCRPISNTACYPEIDTGVIVARYNSCLVSWGSSPIQCSGWTTLGDGQEFVVLTVDDCSYDVTIESLEACADSIQIEYRVQGTCSSCDGNRSNFRVLVLPRDARPVVAVSRGIVMPPCPPPPPP